LGSDPITPEINRRLGGAAYLVTEAGVGIDPVTFTSASDGLTSQLLRYFRAQQISTIVFRALAFAEAKVPCAHRDVPSRAIPSALS
jgi:hypothetical protein